MSNVNRTFVVICFQISIFDPLETTVRFNYRKIHELWFAFKLVSLTHWKQQVWHQSKTSNVVICFQISIFDPLETTHRSDSENILQLWFAFKLVSLTHWKQRDTADKFGHQVVICFQISIFDPLETTTYSYQGRLYPLWFAFKLVSLTHWKQLILRIFRGMISCDLLSN